MAFRVEALGRTLERGLPDLGLPGCGPDGTCDPAQPLAAASQRTSSSHFGA